LNAPPSGFWGSRWHAQVPWRRLFWRDMLVVGSVINLFTGFVALMLFAQDQPMAAVLAVHVAPLPYNAFLLASLWRHPQPSAVVKWVGLGWFAGMLVV
jgi:hypothetical protein